MAVSLVFKRCLSMSAHYASDAKVALRNKIAEFPIAYPDFLLSPVLNRRVPLYEQLVYADMFERRMVVDIPEFYVGSLMAVTVSDANQTTRKNRFVGICVNRNRVGLHHRFTLRNVVDGMGVEVMYDLYNPTILKIETLKLERRLDDDLSYLIDALPEYSTVPFDLEPVSHPAGTPVPVNPLKVKMRPPPWIIRYGMHDFKGIENTWDLTTPYYKRKLVIKTKIDYFYKYDIVQHYRDQCQELEHDDLVQEQMLNYEANRLKVGDTEKKILRSVASESKKREGSSTDDE